MDEEEISPRMQRLLARGRAEAREKIGCTCSSYDGRGRSVCGFPCSVHKPTHDCLTCKEVKVAEGRSCANCDFTVNGCEE